jgi:hypothetical protein
MLSKLNDLYNSLVYESAEDIWIRKINSDTEFFETYLQPLNTKYYPEEFYSCKTRLNTFCLCGIFKAVIEILEKFSVGTDFWDDEIMGKPFALYNPMVTFGEIIHIMNFDEGIPVGTAEKNSLYAAENEFRFQQEGRWHIPKQLDSEKEFGFKVNAKSCTPKELVKMLDSLREEFGYDEGKAIAVEFSINCNNLSNQIWDEETTFIPVVTNEEDLKAEDKLVDKINDFEAKTVEPTAKCELPKENTENKVKVPTPTKKNSIDFSKPVVHSYDTKNLFKTKKVN